MKAGVINFFLQEFENQHGRMLFWVPFLLGIGIFIFFSLPFDPSLWVAGLGMTACLSALILAPPSCRSLCLVMVLIAAGFFLSALRTVIVYTPMLQSAHGPADITGTIERIEDYGAGEGSRITLSDLQVEGLSATETPRRIRLRLRADEGVEVGQRISALAKLHKVSGPLIPGGFDFQRYLYFQGIGAVGFMYYPPDIVSQAEVGGIRRIVENLRTHIARRIETAISHPEAGIAVALMTGQRQAISEEDQQAMRDAGLAHMLAISGLHVGLLSGVVFFLVRLGLAAVPYLALRWPIKKIAALSALLAALGYTLMAGAPIPTQRALFMVGFVLLAIMLDRDPFSLRLVAVAAVIILALYPESLFSVSFQFSFAAVTALVMFYEWLRPTLRSWYRQAGWLRRLALYFWGIVITTFIASSAIAPFALFHFQRFVVYDIPANVLAGPIMAFWIMPSVVLSFAGLALGLEVYPLTLMQGGISQMLTIAHEVSAWPQAVILLPQWSALAAGLFMCGAYILLLWRGRLRWLGAFIILTGLWPLSIFQMPDALITDNFKLIAVKDNSHKIYISQKRSEAFVRENWARAYGVEESSLYAWPDEGVYGPLHCGEAGCRIELAGQNISYIRHEAAMNEACIWAHVILSPRPLPDCPVDGQSSERPGPYIIDFFDARYGGNQALWIDDTGVRIQAANDLRGRRYWSQSRGGRE